MASLQKCAQIEIAGDVYICRHRRGTGELLMNIGYDRIGIFDCLASRKTGEIVFDDDDFAIYRWVVSPDGATSYVFSSDDLDYAFELDLRERKSKRIVMPDQHPTLGELCWFDPSFAILGYGGVLWKLKDGEIVAADDAERNAYVTPSHEAILKDFAVTKMANTDDGLYVRAREYQRNRIGFVSLDGSTKLLSDQDGSAVDHTHYGKSLYIAFQAEIVRDDMAVRSTVARTGDEERFVSVNTVGDGKDSRLGVLVSGEEHATTAHARLDIYEFGR